MPELIEVRERRGKKLKEVLNAIGAYCTETAPCADGFALEKGLEIAALRSAPVSGGGCPRF